MTPVPHVVVLPGSLPIQEPLRSPHRTFKLPAIREVTGSPAMRPQTGSATKEFFTLPPICVDRPSTPHQTSVNGHNRLAAALPVPVQSNLLSVPSPMTRPGSLPRLTPSPRPLSRPEPLLIRKRAHSEAEHQRPRRPLPPSPLSADVSKQRLVRPQLPARAASTSSIRHETGTISLNWVDQSPGHVSARKTSPENGSARPGRRSGRKSRAEQEQLRLEQFEQKRLLLATSQPFVRNGSYAVSQHQYPEPPRQGTGPSRSATMVIEPRHPTLASTHGPLPGPPSDEIEPLAAHEVETVNQFGEREIVAASPRHMLVSHAMLMASNKKARRASMHHERGPQNWVPSALAPPTPISATFRQKQALHSPVEIRAPPIIARGADQLLTAAAFDIVALQLAQRNQQLNGARWRQQDQQQQQPGQTTPRKTSSPSATTEQCESRAQTSSPESFKMDASLLQRLYSVHRLGLGPGDRPLFFRLPHRSDISDKFVRRESSSIKHEQLAELVGQHAEMLWHTYFCEVQPCLPILTKHQLLARVDPMFPTTLLAAIYLLAIPHLPASFRDGMVAEGRFAKLETMLRLALIEEAECADLVTVCGFLHWLYLSPNRDSLVASSFGEAGFDVEGTNRLWMMTTLLLNCTQQLGLYMDPEQWLISDNEKHMRRRLWWFTLTIEKWNALICGRRSSLRAGQYNVEMLALPDFSGSAHGRMSMPGQITWIANADMALLLADILEVLYDNPITPAGTERLMLSSLLKFRSSLPELYVPEEGSGLTFELSQALCQLQLHLSFMTCWTLVLKSLMDRAPDQASLEAGLLGQLSLSLGLECLLEYCKLLDTCATIREARAALWPPWMGQSMLIVALFAVRLVAGSAGPSRDQTLRVVSRLYAAFKANQRTMQVVEAPLRVLKDTGVVMDQEAAH